MDNRSKSKATILYAVAALSASSCASQTIGDIKPAVAADISVISAMIPGSTAIRLQEVGDLDSDGDLDALVVPEKTGNPLARNEPRALLIFLRNKSGVLEIAATSPTAILCQACGGGMGDPLQGIDPVPGGFVLRFEGGSRELWQRRYRFSHSPGARTWLLDAIDSKVLDRIDGNDEQRNAEAPAFEPVPIEKFDPKDFLEDTISDL